MRLSTLVLAVLVLGTIMGIARDEVGRVAVIVFFTGLSTSIAGVASIMALFQTVGASGRGQDHRRSRRGPGRDGRGPRRRLLDDARPALRRRPLAPVGHPLKPGPPVAKRRLASSGISRSSCWWPRSSSARPGPSPREWFGPAEILLVATGDGLGLRGEFRRDHPDRPEGGGPVRPPR